MIEPEVDFGIVCSPMGRLGIQSLNIVALVIILIGVPAATSVRLGGLFIGSRPAWEMVTLALLATMGTANFLAWLCLGSTKKQRQLWLRWCAVHLILLAIELAFFENYLSFKWLQKSLLWLKSQL